MENKKMSCVSESASGQEGRSQSIWSNLWRFFQIRRHHRVYPICEDLPPKSITEIWNSKNESETAPVQLEESASEVPLMETSQGMNEVEAEAGNGSQCELLSNDVGVQIPELKLEQNAPPVLNEAPRETAEETNEDDLFLPYYTAEEIVPRRRSKRTEKKLDKIKSSFKRAPRVCVSPVEGDYDMERVFMEESLAFARQRMAFNKGLELVEPSSQKKPSWIKSMKRKVLNKLSWTKKKKDEVKGALPNDEILDSMKKSEENTMTQSPKK